MLSGQSCSWEKTWAKAHMGGYDFKKILYENDPKIKNKHDSENFNFVQYLYNETICRPPQSREAIPLKR
jgi:hypothetical protein